MMSVMVVEAIWTIYNASSVKVNHQLQLKQKIFIAIYKTFCSENVDALLTIRNNFAMRQGVLIRCFISVLD